MTATVVKGSGTAYTGVTGTVTSHTDEHYFREFAEAVFDQTAVLKALSSKAWAKKDNYGNKNAKTKNGVMFYDGFQFSGRLATTAPSATKVAKGGTLDRHERDDWTGWAYDDIRLAIPLAIEDMDIEDNSGMAKLASLTSDELKLASAGMADDINKLFLGTSTAVDTTIGLPYMTSVTQTGSIGGIARTNSYWKNWHKEVTDAGGGGDYDKPLNLYRAILAAFVGTSGYASVNGPDLCVSNIGAFLTLARMSESLFGLVDKKGSEALHALGVNNYLVNGAPLIHDTAATKPWGGTDGDFIYGINTNCTGLAFKRNSYMKIKPWVAPDGASDDFYHKSVIVTRVTPYCKDRRANFAIHGLTANTEATSD